ncbi:MAG: P-loop NTPase family protein [Planctomycetota bacterium]|jgi:predicted ABC-type transport system involved in lysophospholipase L1 biosynthesis ATPase subunit
MVASKKSDSPILELKDVTAAAAEQHDVGLEHVNLALKPGELALVTVGLGRSLSPLPSIAQGLYEPDAGEVRFLGEAWTDMATGDAARMRARIGRVFARGGWLSDLDMDENMTLRQRHHGGHTLRSARADAKELAERFGVEQVLRARPAALGRHELHVAQWVRALLADPALILLERPGHEVQPESMPLLVDAIKEERERGAAVVWITESPERPGPAACAPDHRLDLSPHEASVQIPVRA